MASIFSAECGAWLSSGKALSARDAQGVFEGGEGADGGRFCCGSHEAVNAYIRGELLRGERLRVEYEGGVRLVAVRGLWRSMGQFGHVGLRRWVAYVDEAFFDDPRARGHELAELRFWDEFRQGLRVSAGFVARLKGLLECEVVERGLSREEQAGVAGFFEERVGCGLSRGMMRWWIRTEYERALEVAERIHCRAEGFGSVEALRDAALARGMVPVCRRGGVVERDVNIAAGDNGYADFLSRGKGGYVYLDDGDDDDRADVVEGVLAGDEGKVFSPGEGTGAVLNGGNGVGGWDGGGIPKGGVWFGQGDVSFPEGDEPFLGMVPLVIDEDDLSAGFDGMGEVDIGYTTLNVRDGVLVNKEKLSKRKHLKSIISTEDHYRDIADIIGKMGRVKGKSIGVALGFYSNEQLFFWVETLARLRLAQDLADFVPDVIKRGEQSKALFSEGKAYGLKFIYKEHRNQAPGATFRSFELAHKRLSGLVTAMFIGGFKSDREKHNGCAAVEKIVFLATNEYVAHRGRRFIDDLLDFFRKMWRMGVFDGDLFGLAGNKPGLSKEGHFLVLDFGSVKDTIQDKLFETEASLGDDPFHMAIDKLHVTRDKLHEISVDLSDYFEESLLRRYGMRLFPTGEWQKGRSGSRGKQKAIPLAHQLKQVVKAHRPLKAPMEHYVNPFIGEPINSFIADKVRRRRSYEKRKPLRQWGEDAARQRQILREQFPQSSEVIDWLVSAEEVGISALWSAYRLSDVEESLSLLREPFFFNNLKKAIEDFKQADLLGSGNLKKSFLNDFNQTILALLSLASNENFKRTFVYLAQRELLGNATLAKSFRWEPIRFCQSFERIVSLWNDEINRTMMLIPEDYSTLQERWSLLLQFDPVKGAEVMRRCFEYDSLKLTRIFMEISRDHNVIRSFNFLKGILGLDTLRALYRRDFFEFFEVLNMPYESRVALEKRLAFIKRELFSLEAIQSAFVEEPLFFISTIPFLLDDWRKAISEGYKTDKGGIDINRFLEKYQSKIIFVNSNVAGLNSTKGLAEIWGLKLANYEVGLRNQMRESRDLVKERFPEETITENIEASRGRVILRYLNEVDFPVSRFPHEPFKLILPPKADESVRKRIRAEMNLGDRKLIVVSSPLPKEIEIVTHALKQFPPAERPLVIMGMRDEDKTLKDKLISRGFKTINRSDRREAMSAFCHNDIVVLNTRGELLDLLCAADLSIVGMDRNLFEPASQDVPILYFNGSWQNNLSQLKLLSGLDGAQVIEPSSLHEQIVYMTRKGPEITRGIKAAIQKFKTNVIPAANLIGSLAITNMIVKNNALLFASTDKEENVVENVIPEWSE